VHPQAEKVLSKKGTANREKEDTMHLTNECPAGRQKRCNFFMPPQLAMIGECIGCLLLTV